ncbi:MAG: stage 0 sporulation protein [Candidatus Cloacimonadota bacterium]|nr:MAG: stage 0 sporulation protein [Candidatus Cloacimonadota bacterium]
MLYEVSVRDKQKIVFTNPDLLNIKKKDYVITKIDEEIETIGRVVDIVDYIEDTYIQGRIVRIATEQDLEEWGKNKELEKKALEFCKEKIVQDSLKMKLIDVECQFDRHKLKFFFIADGRIDFRNLVRDLAATFKTRIEMRQIGVRDYAKRIGGLGLCGRPFCCRTFLKEFQPVTIRVARNQDININPQKISGVCGRLMCCLTYEEAFYATELKKYPKIGTKVETEKGKGAIIKINIFTEEVTVRFEDDTEEAFHRSKLTFPERKWKLFPRRGFLKRPKKDEE